MFTISIGKAETNCPDKITLTSGMVKAVQVAFNFSDEWEGFIKTAIFSNGSTTTDVPLDKEDKCYIPHEVLAVPGEEVTVGVYGCKGEGDDYVAIPTEKQSLGEVIEGVDPSGEEPKEPTPTVWDELNIKVESLSKELIDARNKVYTRDESDLLLDVHSIVHKETLSLTGDELEGKKDSDHIFLKNLTKDNAVVFGEEYETMGRFFGYVGVTGLRRSVDYVLVAEIDIETDFDISKARVQGFTKAGGGSETPTLEVIGTPKNGKNYVIYPCRHDGGNTINGFYFDAQAGNSPTVKITLCDVRVYKRVFALELPIDNKEVIKDWKCEPYQMGNGVVSSLDDYALIYTDVGSFRKWYFVSLTGAKNVDVLLYKPSAEVFANKEEVKALSEKVGAVEDEVASKAKQTDLTALEKSVGAKGLTFKQYNAKEKIPLEKDCLYYIRCNKDTVYYYKNGSKLSQYTSGFGDGFVMMASNIFQGAHVNYFAAPAESGFMSFDMNGYTITTLDTDEVYAMSSSDVVNVWKLHA